MPWMLKKLLQLNKADLIGVGRAILKDDSWAKKCNGTKNNAKYWYL